MHVCMFLTWVIYPLVSGVLYVWKTLSSFRLTYKRTLNTSMSMTFYNYDHDNTINAACYDYLLRSMVMKLFGMWISSDIPPLFKRGIYECFISNFENICRTCESRRTTVDFVDRSWPLYLFHWFSLTYLIIISILGTSCVFERSLSLLLCRKTILFFRLIS